MAVLLAGLGAGCSSAHVVSTPDAAALPDAGATPDTGVPARDAGPDIVFADDFDDGTFTDDWMLRNAEAEQTGGALVSGPSCMSIEDCPDGPMLLYTHELFPLGDGRLTVDYDAYSGVNARFRNRIIVDLQAEVRGTRISANPDGSTRDLDAVLRGFWHLGGTEPFYSLTSCARCFRSDSVQLERDDVMPDDDTWHHVQLRFCGADGMAMRVTTRDGTVLADESSTLLNATPPPDVSEVYVLLWLEGEGKRIDNLVIRRGCDPF